MPNVVTTLLRFSKVNSADLRKFLKIHGSSMDFNEIIPVPDYILLDKLPNSSESLEAYKYLVQGEPMGYFLTNLVNLYRRGNEDDSKTINRLIGKEYIDLKLGKKMFLLEQQHGELSYFKWIQENWGSTNPIEVRIKDNVLLMETAWSAPIPIIKAIYNHFPDGIFSAVWCDEFVDIAGSMELYHGGIEEFHADGGSGDAIDCYYEIRKFEENEYKERQALMKKGA